MIPWHHHSESFSVEFCPRPSLYNTWTNQCHVRLICSISVYPVITELTGFSPSSSLSSAFLLSFFINTHIHLIVVILVLCIFTSCFTYIGLVSLPCITTPCTTPLLLSFLVPKMTYSVSSGTLNPIHSLSFQLQFISVVWCTPRACCNYKIGLVNTDCVSTGLVQFNATSDHILTSTRIKQRQLKNNISRK